MTIVHKQYDVEFYDQFLLSIYPKESKEFIDSRYKNRIISIEREVINTSVLISQARTNALTQSKSFERAGMMREYHDCYYGYLAYKKQYYDHMKKLKESECEIMKEYHDNLLRFYNDQKTFPIGLEKLEPSEVSKKDDLIPSQALSIIGDQITNRSVDVWDYVAIGKSQATPSMADEFLKSQVAVYPIAENGSFTSLNDQLRLFHIIPETLETTDIYETAIASEPIGRPIFNRTVYDDGKPLRHETGITFPVISMITYMTSR